MESRKTHTFNRYTFIRSMKTKGWIMEETGGWVVPLGKTLQDRDKDWEESILEAVECCKDPACGDGAA